MKAKVTELQQVFVDRIEAGEFELVSVCNNRYATFLIDGYTFNFCNIKGHTTIFQGALNNFMQLPEISNGSYVIEAIEKSIKQAKIEALNKLQQEIQEL